MDKIQYEHWIEFCRAMTFHGIEATERRKERLWNEASAFIEAYKDEPVDGWDNDFCLCDHFNEHFDEYLETIFVENNWGGGYYKDGSHFANQLSIIIRAGVDAATETGAGVLGYTVGDLRQMFGGQVPEWVACQYEGCLLEAEDAAGIWL